MLHFLKNSSLLFIVVILQSCNGLFYQPSKNLFVDPLRYNLHPQLISFAAPDKNKLYGWYFKTKKKKKGVVLHYHGNAQNITSHYLFLVWLTNFGYDYFIFDYRGYGMSEGEPEREGINKDAVAAYDLVRKNFLKEENKFILIGQSLGGAILMRSFQNFEEKEKISGIVIDSSFYSYQEIARDKMDQLWLTWPFQHLAYLLISDDYSPEEIIPTISPIPFLVMHGTEDKVVPYYHGVKIYNLAKEPKLFWKIESGKHASAMQAHNGIYRKKLLDFLDKLN